MLFKKYIETISKIQNDIKSILPNLDSLEKSKKDALWQKLKLEWNYNSNHIEGNTLTYNETELLILTNKESGAHSKREFSEMKAHNVAIEQIINLSNDKERAITESDVRSLNKIILVEPYWNPAITADGKETKIEIIPGKYKDQPNHVRLQNGEIYKYAEPSEVPQKMKKLLDWFNTPDNINPVEKAALFHYEFICIHPFGDGNGRLARLLMNYYLIKNGLMPAIIKSNDKNKYLFALNKADKGEISYFLEYIAEQCIWSMNLLFKLVKGENINEPDDWKKELNMLKNSSKTSAVKRTPELTKEILETSIIPALYYIIEKLKDDFDGLFEKNLFKVTFNSYDLTQAYEKKSILDTHFIQFAIDNQSGIEIKIELLWINYNKNGLNIFNIKEKFSIKFEDYSIEIVLPTNLFRIRKGYNEIIENNEAELFYLSTGELLFGQIKQHIQ